VTLLSLGLFLIVTLKSGVSSFAMVTSTTLSLGLSAAAAAFIGYCVYFDHKRRSHPDFRKKLKEKRKQMNKTGSGKDGAVIVLPDLRDQEAVQSFFLEQVQKGESLLAEGQIEAGVEHLAMAVAVCGQPHALLGVLQQTIPPQIYALLLQNVEKAQKKVRAAATSMMGGPSGRPGGPSMNPMGSIEDLE